jgi:hypothetical protein
VLARSLARSLSLSLSLSLSGTGSVHGHCIAFYLKKQHTLSPLSGHESPREIGANAEDNRQLSGLPPLETQVDSCKGARGKKLCGQT